MLELLLRITFSLLVVFGIMWALARLARRPLARGGHGAVTVLARTQLTRNASIAVVQVADRALVLGVTDTQVSMLTEADTEAVRSRLPEPAARRAMAADARFRTGDGALATTDDPLGPLGRPDLAGALGGSLLSPRTWRQLVDFLRERTVRR